MTMHVVLSTPGGDVHGVLAHPASTPRGAVIVFQEAFGLTPYLEGVCDRLADDGWLALAPSVFRMLPGAHYSPDELPAALAAVNSMTAEGTGEVLDGTVTFLDQRGFPPARTGVVGFCMGGTLSLLAATELGFGAAVTFYGGRIRAGAYGYGSLVEQAPMLLCPWLGLYGDLDRGLPVAQVERLRAAASRAPAPTELVRYADADHGFHNATRSDIHHPAAASDAWGRCMHWLDAHVSG
ncbi:MAG: dienelactone hydrolase family protein [Ilumatobacteraceae bacterium]